MKQTLHSQEVSQSSMKSNKPEAYHLFLKLRWRVFKSSIALLCICTDTWERCHQPTCKLVWQPSSNNVWTTHTWPRITAMWSAVCRRLFLAFASQPEKGFTNKNVNSTLWSVTVSTFLRSIWTQCIKTVEFCYNGSTRNRQKTLPNN